ncbi:MAG: hypothetical protein WAX04_11970, partial [Oscillospiraceae bacterium]
STIDQNKRFEVFRSDRLDRVGGGVCIMVVNDFRCSRVTLSNDDQNLLTISQCDLICLDVFISCIKYRLILVFFLFFFI